MITGTRNELFAQHKDLIPRTMNRNRLLLRALGLEQDDVYQELAIVALKAIDAFDPRRSEDIRAHIWMKLQYAVLDLKRNHCPYGMTGLDRSTVCVYSVELREEQGNPLPAPAPDEDVELSPAMRQALSRLNAEERRAVIRYLNGQELKREQTVKAALDKIKVYYLAADPRPQRTAFVW